MDCIFQNREEIVSHIAALEERLRHVQYTLPTLVSDAINCDTGELPLPITDVEGLYVAIAKGLSMPASEDIYEKALAYAWTCLATEIAKTTKNPDHAIQRIQWELVAQSNVKFEFEHLQLARRWSDEMSLVTLSGSGRQMIHAECDRMWVLLDPLTGKIRNDHPPSILEALCREHRAKWWIKFSGIFDFYELVGALDSAGGYLYRDLGTQYQSLIEKRMAEIDAELR